MNLIVITKYFRDIWAKERGLTLVSKVVLLIQISKYTCTSNCIQCYRFDIQSTSIKLFCHSIQSAMFLVPSSMKRIQMISEGYFFQNLVHHCDFQILHCDSIRQLLFSSFFEYRYTRRNKYTFGYMTRQTKVDDDSHAKVFHFWLLSNRKCNWILEGKN